MYPVIFLFLFASQFPVSLKTDQIIDCAFLNAKKGIYWGLSQCSSERKSIRSNLVDDDKLVCSVRVEKEINGVQVESSGFYGGCEVKILVHKSTDNLMREGFLKYPAIDSASAKKKRK